MENSNIFDLIDIVLAGESHKARPTKFVSDYNGDIISVDAYETTCPKCSQLVSIDVTKIIKHDGVAYVSGCDDCPVPEEVLESGSKIKKTITKNVKPNKFIKFNPKEFSDPIEAGVMPIEGAIKFEI